jgi:hypothetical protein
MRKAIFIFLFAFIAAVGIARDKKNDKNEKVLPVYIWGASISFSDTIAYFTEIQELDNVVLVNDLLPHRQYYAYQLKDYMNFEENMPGRISVIYFEKKRHKLEQKEAKIKKRLVEKDNMTVRYLGDKFKFVKP